MKLIIEDDEGHKTVVPFVRDEISIGRQEGNTIRLTERNVSRKHARLTRQNGSIYIEDLGSYNGVQVNGEKISAQSKVKEGDLIEIGDYDLAIEGAPAAGDGDTNPTTPNAAAPASDATPTGAPPTPRASPAAPAAAGQASGKGGATAVIRLSDLGKGSSEVEERDLSANESPKIVGLSGNFRGKEFTLKRSVTRFGRTDEGNEVVIDHQSISRNHGKFQLEAEGWVVYDNKSANGMKVNGDEYGMSPVKPGDTIELGHVKFRFCAPGEAFTPPREASSSVSTSGGSSDAAPAAGGSKTGLIVGIVVAVLVLGGIGGFLAMPKKLPPDKDPCIQGKNALAAKDWAKAIERFTYSQTAQIVCEFDVDSQVAKAKAEQDAKAQLDEADELLGGEKWKKSISALKKVPMDSVYAPDAKSKIEEYTALGVKSLEDAANKAIAANKADEAAALVDELEALDPAAGAIAGLRTQIQEKKAAAAKAAAAAAAAAAAPKKSQEERDADATKYLAEGVAAIKGGDYAGGIDAMLKALQENPKSEIKAKVYRNLGVAYARNKDNANGCKYLKAYVKEAPGADDRAKVEAAIAQTCK